MEKDSFIGKSPCYCFCRLEVWPGFITSILQYERSVMLCLEISHKILRTDTVLDIMYEVYGRSQRGGSFHDMAKKELIGQIVLTRYNNKTYRIDDIDFEKTPAATFNVGREQTEINFVDYYKKVSLLFLGLKK